METQWVALADIEAGPNRRTINREHVSRLAASIREIGLQTPPTVLARKDDDGWRFILVTGAHRVEALLEIGEDGVECIVLPDDQDAADLWEIDENLARAELTDAQRAEHHARREAILVRRGEAARPGRGGDRSNGQNVRSYAAKTATDLGVDERTVRRDLARGKKIAPDVLAEVAGTDLDKGVVLDELARTPAAQQPARLDEIRAQREAHKLNKERNRVIALTDAELFANWLMARTDLNELDTIISWLEGTKPRDVIAALRRESA